MTVDEADKLSFEIFQAIMDKHPEVKHVSIHFCPHRGRGEKYTLPKMFSVHEETSEIEK
ncbi:hypothetical protein [Archaeoglobus sp.]